MPRASTNGGVNWLSLSIAGGAVLITLVGNLLAFISGGTEKLEKRVTNIESDLAWKFVSKELAAKDFGFIDRLINELKASKTDKDVYEQKSASVDRQMTIMRDHLKEIVAALQARMVEVERVSRTTPRQ